MDRSLIQRWRSALALLLVPVALGGCGFIPAEDAPTLVSHRAAAGRFPENSRSAIRAALDAGDAALEVDVVLTRDQVPVLSHDAWLDAELCTRADGSALPADEKIRIMDLTYLELINGYRCGGIEDPETPGAEVVEDTHVTLAELLIELIGHPEVTLQLDIKQDPEDTLDANTYAAVILGHWNLANLPNPMYVTAIFPETLRAFEGRQPEITTLRIWPNFPPGSNSTLVGLGNEFTRMFGFQELVQLIEEAEADGIAIAYQVADRGAMEVVRQAGYQTALWTANSEAALEVFCTWPIDYLITDYPERAPCR
ncbi:MAG TPA: glycerophosphodiester phosphodiesterase [Myxococcaceae bacterium]|nr:glycerophosphodiester phosphodiesterase [Myxococcaceae bacterium]